MGWGFCEVFNALCLSPLQKRSSLRLHEHSCLPSSMTWNWCLFHNEVCSHLFLFFKYGWRGWEWWASLKALRLLKLWLRVVCSTVVAWKHIWFIFKLVFWLLEQLLELCRLNYWTCMDITQIHKKNTQKKKKHANVFYIILQSIPMTLSVVV